MRGWGSFPFGGGVGGGRFAARTVAVRSSPPFILPIIPKIILTGLVTVASCLVCVCVCVDYASRVTNHDAAYEQSDIDSFSCTSEWRFSRNGVRALEFQTGSVAYLAQPMLYMCILCMYTLTVLRVRCSAGIKKKQAMLLPVCPFSPTSRDQALHLSILMQL